MPKTIRGFSLIELMVVIFIIGMMLTLGVLAVGSDNRQRDLATEGERMVALIRLAEEEAITTVSELGLRMRHDGYDFMVLNGQEWQTVNAPPFTSRQFRDPDVEVELELEGNRVNIELEPKKPQILILSSGELTPFELALDTKGQEHPLLVRGTFAGDITLRHGDEE